MFNILNKKILLTIIPIVVFSFFAVNDVGATTYQWAAIDGVAGVGGVQQVPEGYALTGIGANGDFDPCSLYIKTAPIINGEIDFSRVSGWTWDVSTTGEHSPARCTTAKVLGTDKGHYSDYTANSVITGWNFEMNYGEISGNPQTCFYQEWAPLSNINNRTNDQTRNKDGSCRDKRGNNSTKVLLRAPQNNVIVGILFASEGGGKVNALATTKRTIYPAPVPVQSVSNWDGQKYVYSEGSATQGNPIQLPGIKFSSGAYRTVILKVSELTGDSAQNGPYTWTTESGGVNYLSSQSGILNFVEMTSGSVHQGTLINLQFRTAGQKVIKLTSATGKTGFAYINIAETPVVDVCPNIAGAQASIPAGMVQDSYGNCITPYSAPTCQVTAPAEADRYVNTPIAVKAAGGDGTYAWTVPDGTVSSAGQDAAVALFNIPGTKMITVTSAGMDGLCPAVEIKQKDVCPNIDGIQPTIPDGKVVDGSGNCITPPGPITQPSCSVVPRENDTNAFRKALNQAKIIRVDEETPVKGSGGDGTYAWSSYLAGDTSFTLSPSVSNSLTSIIARTAGTKFIKVSSGGLSSMCTAFAISTAVDVCPNISGDQSAIPDGMVKDAFGNCITPITPSDPVLTCEFQSASIPNQKTGTPLTVKASGGTGSYSWSVLTQGSITKVGQDTASAVFQNGGTNVARVSSGSQTGECSIFLLESLIVTDVCPNLGGNQPSVPDGMIKNGDGNCVAYVPVSTVSCQADPGEAEVGQQVNFTASGGDGVNYSWSGNVVVDSPNNTAGYQYPTPGHKIITVASGGMSNTCTVEISKPKRPAPTANIWIDGGPEIFLPNNSFTVKWSSTDAESCSVSGSSLSSSATGGSQLFTDKARGTYNFSITCQNESGSASANTSVSIKEVPQCLFTANPANIVPPQSSTLNWSCQYASNGCSIDNNIGGVDSAGGSKDVRPTKTTTYTLSCGGLDGDRDFPATVSIDFIPWLKEIIPIW